MIRLLLGLQHCRGRARQGAGAARSLLGLLGLDIVIGLPVWAKSVLAPVAWLALAMVQDVLLLAPLHETPPTHSTPPTALPLLGSHMA